jgi:hypothetical protein
MSTKVVCPDCGGVIGELSPGDVPCKCLLESEPMLEQNTPSDTATIESPRGEKVCHNCGKNVAGHRRVKDSRGYLCYQCAKAERAAEREGKVRCKECRKMIPRRAGRVQRQDDLSQLLRSSSGNRPLQEKGFDQGIRGAREAQPDDPGRAVRAAGGHRGVLVFLQDARGSSSVSHPVAPTVAPSVGSQNPASKVDATSGAPQWAAPNAATAPAGRAPTSAGSSGCAFGAFGALDAFGSFDAFHIDPSEITGDDGVGLEGIDEVIVTRRHERAVRAVPAHAGNRSAQRARHDTGGDAIEQRGELVGDEDGWVIGGCSSHSPLHRQRQSKSPALAVAQFIRRPQKAPRLGQSHATERGQRVLERDVGVEAIDQGRIGQRQVVEVDPCRVGRSGAQGAQQRRLARAAGADDERDVAGQGKQIEKGAIVEQWMGCGWTIGLGVGDPKQVRDERRPPGADHDRAIVPRSGVGGDELATWLGMAAFSQKVECVDQSR